MLLVELGSCITENKSFRKQSFLHISILVDKSFSYPHNHIPISRMDAEDSCQVGSEGNQKRDVDDILKFF